MKDTTNEACESASQSFNISMDMHTLLLTELDLFEISNYIM